MLFGGAAAQGGVGRYNCGVYLFDTQAFTWSLPNPNPKPHRNRNPNRNPNPNPNAGLHVEPPTRLRRCTALGVDGGSS